MATDRTGLYIMVIICMLASCRSNDKLARIEAKLGTDLQTISSESGSGALIGGPGQGIADALGLEPAE